MKYSAITLDTSVFDRNGLRLQQGLLKKLEQFKNLPAKLVISEVVLGELRSHLCRKVSESRIQLERALNECSEFVPIDIVQIGAIKASLTRQTAEDITEKNISDFLDRTGAEIVMTEPFVQVSDLLQRYFQVRPPFSESGKKKSEFPDAMALLSLESYAKINQQKIIAVSLDTDWHEFAKYCECIDVVSDLAEAIAMFLPKESAFAFCRRLGMTLQNGVANSIEARVTSYLAKRVAALDVIPHAQSDFTLTWDCVEFTYRSFEFPRSSESEITLYPVEAQGEELVIGTKVRIHVSASTTFYLLVYNEVYQDLYPIESLDKIVDFAFDTELVLTVKGDFTGDVLDIEVVSVEMQSYPRIVDFGSLDEVMVPDDLVEI